MSSSHFEIIEYGSDYVKVNFYNVIAVSLIGAIVYDKDDNEVNRRASNSETTFTVGGLNPGELHTVQYYYCWETYSPKTYDGTDVITTTGFAWTDTEIAQMYTGGNCKVITTARWNEFVKAVESTMTVLGALNDTVSEADIYLNNLHTSYTFEDLLIDSQQITTDKKLYAKSLNSVRFMIGSYMSTGIDPFYTGDPIPGELLKDLQYYLNEIHIHI